MRLFRFPFAFLLLFTVNSYSQDHYLVELDRITGERSYLKMEIVHGRPVESPIAAPQVRKGDLLTVRVKNVNELVFGLEVEDHLIEKQGNNLAKTLLNNPLMEGMTLSPVLKLLTGIISNPPPPARGEEGGISINTVYDGYVKMLNQISQVEKKLSIIYDEGATYNEVVEQLSLIRNTFQKESISESISKLTVQLSTISENGSTPLMDSIASGLAQVKMLEKSGYLSPGFNIEQVESLISKTDFMVEQTFIIGGKESAWSSGGTYDQYLVYLFLYKLGDVVQDPAQLTRKPYVFDRDQFENGDRLRQVLTIKLPVRNARKPSWSLGIGAAFTPASTYLYTPEENAALDSIRFRSDKAGGVRTLLMVDLNIPLPSKSRQFSYDLILGLGVALKSPEGGKLSGALDFSQSMVTTGIGASLIRFPWLSVKGGLAWGKFQRLSSTYQPDKWYQNNLSQAAIDAAVSKKIRPVPYLSLGIKL